MQATAGRTALRKIVAHVAPNARGHRVLRQWQDGDDVCTLYQFDVEADAAMTSLLVSEWNTVRGGQVASSFMVFDTGRFRGAGPSKRDRCRSGPRHDRRARHRRRATPIPPTRLLLLRRDLRGGVRR
jgi:hypothetical protein